MQLRIRSRDVELAPDVRGAVERRLRLATGRHLALISVARATFSPCATHRGGEATRCRIHLRFRTGAVLVIEDRGEDCTAAAARAAWRLEHRLDRERGLRLDRVAGLQRSLGDGAEEESRGAQSS